MRSRLVFVGFFPGGRRSSSKLLLLFRHGRMVRHLALLVLSTVVAFQPACWPPRMKMRSAASFSDMDPKLDIEFTPEEGYDLADAPRYSVRDWMTNLCNLPQSMVLSRIASHLLFNILWSVAVVFWFTSHPDVEVHGMNLPFELSGGIIGVGLAFRTSQSYDRFWRGRDLWALVINKSRSLARLSAAYAMVLTDESPPRDDDDAFAATHSEEVHEEIVRWTVAFAIALKQHLRSERNLAEFDCLNELERSRIATAKHVPLSCCYALSTAIDAYRQPSGVVVGGRQPQVSHKTSEGRALLWWQMEALVTELQDAIGQTEAIAGTPMPQVYTRHTSRLLSVWTLSTPVVLGAGGFPLLFVPLATAIVSWMLLATEEIGHLIEEPFGLDQPQLLPLDRYCNVIKKDLYEQNAVRRRAFYRFDA